MTELGAKLPGRKQSTSTLKIGKTYQVDIKTEQRLDPQQISSYIITKFREEHPELNVNWMKVEGNTIKIQFTPTARMTKKQLSVAWIVTWLETILDLVGLGIIVLSVFEIMRMVPWYVWGSLFLGTILLLWGTKLIPIPEKYK